MHMYNNKIGTQNVKLYTKWATFYEKYKREFEACALVLKEGMEKIPEKEAKPILSYYQAFGDRMTQRYARDFKDELGPLFENLAIDDEATDPIITRSNPLKRSLKQAFGHQEPEQ